LDKVKDLIKPEQFNNIPFYKERFARAFSHMETLEEENLVITLDDPDDDIYF
jgi:hypothetical protein